MDRFIIKANESWLRTKEGRVAHCLLQDTDAFCHLDYHGGGNWKVDGTIENMICTLKNDRTPYPQYLLDSVVSRLSSIIRVDLCTLMRELGSPSIRVCVIPRAKHEEHYADNQKLFRRVVQDTVKSIGFFEDGTHDILRHTDTRTTHSNRSGNGGNGPMPYCGITNETCSISDLIEGKAILLIDDLYTKTVGIDEDAIQALYEKGAKKVYFYSIGRTVSRF
ncbi:MAG: amidophosphoribosyltransferase [Alphaproteobacteria bacterium]|nr:amidophosphoribosyltransferase [Alphaproteobacteria bacterium]